MFVCFVYDYKLPLCFLLFSYETDQKTFLGASKDQCK